MGRRRKHHGGSRLASDQIPGQNQNNICLRPCHSLWYHHQAFRDDTRVVLYSFAPSNASNARREGETKLAQTNVRRSSFDVPSISNFGPRTLPRLTRQTCLALVSHRCKPSISHLSISFYFGDCFLRSRMSCWNRSRAAKMTFRRFHRPQVHHRRRSRNVTDGDGALPPGAC